MSIGSDLKSLLPPTPSQSTRKAKEPLPPKSGVRGTGYQTSPDATTSYTPPFTEQSRETEPASIANITGTEVIDYLRVTKITFKDKYGKPVEFNYDNQ